MRSKRMGQMAPADSTDLHAGLIKSHPSHADNQSNDLAPNVLAQGRPDACQPASPKGLAAVKWPKATAAQD
jgi:hypothetical protein